MEGQDMKTNTSLLEKRILRCGGLVFCVMVTVLCMGLAGDASAASHTLSLTSSGAQSINATGAGGAVISSDSINVATTCRSGYNFTINTSVNDNNLYLGGDASQNESGKYFTPVDGTTTLANSTNTWGYYYNASDPSTAPTSSNIFSPVPTLSNPATVISPLSAPSSTDINDNFNIYYGVSVSPSMPVGTYKMIPDTNNSNNDGTIVYTATISEDCMKYTVHFNPSSYFEGNLITGTGTMSNQSMFEGVATALANNSFTAPTISGTQYYFAGWNTAQDGSGTTYTNGQSVTDLASAGSTITLYAMWTDCPGGKICYSANVSNPSDVTGSMGDQELTKAKDWSSCISTDYKSYCYDSNVDEVDINTLPELDYYSNTLWAPNYKHDGYGFKSWNTKKDGSGTNYGPNQTIELTAEQYSTGGLKLYATWVASNGNMQNWSGCSGMNIGDVTALKDTRDNDVYAVAKLADGKCWTVENLRLDDSAELSSANTHNPSLPLTNSWWYSSANDSDTKPTSNHISAAINLTATPWCMTDSSNCFDQSMLATNNTTLFTNNTASSYSASGNVYSYGNYYNWYSATAGNGTYSKTSGNASGDICPAGWHLPTGGSASAEFGALDVAMGGTGASQSTTEASKRWRTYPNNFVYSGIKDGSSVYDRNSEGCYWSPSANSSNGHFRAYRLRLSSDYASPGTGSGDKIDGKMVRCVAGT